MYYLHCLSKDWYLGGGIAQQFQNKFKIMEQLEEIFHKDKDYQNICLSEKFLFFYRNLSQRS